ncbi:NTP transferase domain-containing protein [bacterium]|nr:NTP transferase domain-containing protein [bacterium]
MIAVILAGGLGTRLRPFTEVIPKPLLPIGGKAILQIQIERLRDNGFKEIYICTNYKSDYIEDFIGDGSRYGVSIIVSKENKRLGTAGPLTLLKRYLKKPFIVMNGDILTSLNFKNFYNFAVDNDSDICLAIKKEVTPYEFGNILFNGDDVLEMQEKPDIVKYILAGIYVINPRVLNEIPNDTYYGMDILINQLISNKMKVLKYEISEYWLDIGRYNDYEKAESDYKALF